MERKHRKEQATSVKSSAQSTASVVYLAGKKVAESGDRTRLA